MVLGTEMTLQEGMVLHMAVWTMPSVQIPGKEGFANEPKEHCFLWELRAAVEPVGRLHGLRIAGQGPVIPPVVVFGDVLIVSKHRDFTGILLPGLVQLEMAQPQVLLVLQGGGSTAGS